MATINLGFSDEAIEMFGQAKHGAKLAQVKNGNNMVRSAHDADPIGSLLYVWIVNSPTNKTVIVRNYRGVKVYEGVFDL